MDARPHGGTLPRSSLSCLVYVPGISKQEIESCNCNLFTRNVDVLDADAVFDKIVKTRYRVLLYRSDYESLIAAFIRIALGVDPNLLE